MVWFHSCSHFRTPFILSWTVNFWFESQRTRWMDKWTRHLDKRHSIPSQNCYWQCPSLPLQCSHNIPSVLHVKKVFKIPKIPAFKSLVLIITCKNFQLLYQSTLRHLFREKKQSGSISGTMDFFISSHPQLGGYDKFRLHYNHQASSRDRPWLFHHSSWHT